MYGFKDKRVAENLARIGKQGVHTSTEGGIHPTADNGSRIYIVTPSTEIPAAAEGTNGPVPGSGTVTVCQLGESEVTPRLGGSVTRKAYNLASDPLPEDRHYIAVEDSFGKLWILSGGTDSAQNYVLDVSGDAFGMVASPEADYPVYASDLSVTSDTVNLYHTVAVVQSVEQVGGSEA